MIGTRRIKDGILDFLAKRTAARIGLNIKMFDVWEPELDEALKVLPEDEVCTHELFSMLCQNPGPARKRILLIKEGSDPVAVACFRFMGMEWVPVTHYIVPGFLFPVKDGYIGKVLEAAGLESRFAWWRWNEPPPNISLRDVRTEPTHRFPLSDDFESYWREYGHFKNIRKYRNRCKPLELRVNEPGMREWTLRSWEQKWRPTGMAELSDLPDRILVAQYLEDHGKYHTLSLHDGDKSAAAATVLIHRGDVVAQYNYRNPEYDWHGAMSRVIDLVFHWSQDMGYEGIDIGGSFDYKDRWAPEAGKKWEFKICPDHILLIRRMDAIISRSKSLLGGMLP